MTAAEVEKITSLPLTEFDKKLADMLDKYIVEFGMKVPASWHGWPPEQDAEKAASFRIAFRRALINTKKK